MDFYLRKGNWKCGSESSSLSHSDKRYGWEDEVNSQGELFHVQHYPFPVDVNEPRNQSLLPTDDSNEKDSPGIFGRLMRRRSSRRSFKRKDNSKVDANLPGSSSFDDQLPVPEVLEKGAEDIESINIYMKIDFSNIKTIGRRATAVETFLGLKVMFYDTKIIILDLIPNGPAFYLQTAFQKGDCLHSINGILVTSENIEQYLRNISFSKEIKEVVLTVHRVKSSKSKVEALKNHLFPEQEDCELEGFGVLFADIGTRGGSSDSVSADDIIFIYPGEGNMLSTIRGTFLTLLHLLPSLGAGQPISTSVISNGSLVHIIYTRTEDDVMFMALPDSRISLKECYWINANVVRCLQFTFQTVSRCFRNERNMNSLQKFFHALFKRLYNRKNNADDFFCEFESLLPAAHRLILPHHIYVQVDDALNELEANDIEIYEDQRLYSIIGSSYFYKGYKVCSHFAKDDLVDIMSLCKQSDILGLMRSGVSELIFWKEAYPASVGRGLGPHGAAPYSLLPASWYLLIVAKDQNFLFVLLESGGYTARIPPKSGPDVAYIEEALATLKHIIKIGIPAVANKLLKTKDEPKPAASNYSPVSTENNLHTSFSETTLNKHHSLSYRSLDISHLPRSRSNINLVSTSSGYCNESLSSDDCPPVIGRRAERELAMETVSRASDVSDDSDWNKDYKSYTKGYSHDLEGTEVSIQPKLTSGKEDVMLHYVHLDKSEGVLISPVTSCPDHGYLLNNFRHHAHQIRKILLNTIAFKKLKTPEVSAVTFNKSLVAIKEHGILFGYEDKKGVSRTYWVVGRLFFSPHLKEVYVCYWDSCPQSMVEVAFRLALKSTF